MICNFSVSPAELFLPLNPKFPLRIHLHHPYALPPDDTFPLYVDDTIEARWKAMLEKKGEKVMFSFSRRSNTVVCRFSRVAFEDIGLKLQDGVSCFQRDCGSPYLFGTI